MIELYNRQQKVVFITLLGKVNGGMHMRYCVSVLTISYLLSL